MGIKSKIVGVTFKNDDGTSRQDILARLETGEPLELRDLADAKYPEAIGVFNVHGEQCGSIEKNLAISLRAKYPVIESLRVQVVQVTGGDGQNYGCNIDIDGAGLENEELAAKLAGLDADIASATPVKATGKIKPKRLVWAAVFAALALSSVGLAAQSTENTMIAIVMAIVFAGLAALNWIRRRK